MRAAKILIVGSGVAGATVAAGLRARGIGPVVMLEAGPRVEMRNHRRWLDHLATGASPYDICRDPDDGPQASWLQNSRLFARGGSTLHWGGWSLRLRPEDFQLQSAAGRGSDWPFGYDELEPWYGRAEHLIGVAGDSGDRSQARGTPYPFPAIPFTQVDRAVIRGFESLGYGYSPMPIARNVTVWNGHNACQTIGTCRYCPLGARYTADQTLDRLETDPGFELRLNAAVREIVVDRRDHAAGVVYMNPETREITRIDAGQIVICAGAIETPRILLRSAGAHWPGGIGNASGHVGRHLSWHPLLFAVGSSPGNPQKLQHELDFPTLCSRHFDTPSEQRAGKLFMFLPQVRPKLDIGALMRAGQTAAQIRAAASGPHRIELQGFMEVHPETESRLGSMRGRDRFGLPSAELQLAPQVTTGPQFRLNLERMERALVAAGYRDAETGVFPPRGDHASGTCRMSENEGDGVVGHDLRVHGMNNLYLCSNAVFPSGGAVNPTLTLAALAIRLAATLEVR